MRMIVILMLLFSIAIVSGNSIPVVENFSVD